ncbi:glucosaminidase, partial [Aliivibrio sp. SR45-2]|nr:glucosaminidase [Aliivibrio sp. SR45-2]
RNEGAAHEVAKFDSSQAAVHAYFMNVNRNNAYKELRVIRLELHKSTEPLTDEQQATVLAKGLIRYSERGEAYVEEIQTMIRHNSQYWR